MTTALLCGAFTPGPADALSSDRNQPIELQADRAEMNNNTGVGIYTGKVALTQGTMKITGDKMTVYTNAERTIERIVVVGQPATFQELPDGQTEPVRARAPHMEYRMVGKGREVELSQGATLIQGMNEFTGQTVHYQLESELVTAKGGPQTQERIHIKFFPNEKKAMTDERKTTR
jgi:lipopolysaccharide export system protein LptA